MSQALTASPNSSAPAFTLPPSLQSRDVNYFTLIEKYKLQERTLHRLEELKSGNTLSDLSSTAFSRGTPSHGVGVGTTNGRSSSRSVTVSFREIVEEFAMRNEVEFLQKLNPKTGETMQTEDGKVLWEFNRVVCYIDNNVLYVKKRMTGDGGNNWYPISFDDLLILSRKR